MTSVPESAGCDSLYFTAYVLSAIALDLVRNRTGLCLRSSVQYVAAVVSRYGRRVDREVLT